MPEKYFLKWKKCSLLGVWFMNILELKDTTDILKDLMESRLILLDSDDPINSLLWKQNTFTFNMAFGKYCDLI